MRTAIPKYMEELHDLPLIFKEFTLAGYDVDRDRYMGKLPETAPKPKNWWDRTDVAIYISLAYEDTGVSALWHIRIGRPDFQWKKWDFATWHHFTRERFQDAIDLFRAYMEGEYTYRRPPNERD